MADQPRRRPWENALGQCGLRVLGQRAWRRLERTHSRWRLDPELGPDQQSKIWWLVRLDDVVALREHEHQPAAALDCLRALERDRGRLESLLAAGPLRRLLHGPLRRRWLADYLTRLDERLELERQAFATIAPHLLEPEPVRLLGGRRSRRSPLAERLG